MPGVVAARRRPAPTQRWVNQLGDDVIEGVTRGEFDRLRGDVTPAPSRPTHQRGPDPAPVLARPRWMEQAVCRGQWRVWLSPDPADRAVAVQGCARCPVQREC